MCEPEHGLLVELVHTINHQRLGKSSTHIAWKVTGDGKVLAPKLSIGSLANHKSPQQSLGRYKRYRY